MSNHLSSIQSVVDAQRRIQEAVGGLSMERYAGLATKLEAMRLPRSLSAIHEQLAATGAVGALFEVNGVARRITKMHGNYSSLASNFGLPAEALRLRDQMERIGAMAALPAHVTGLAERLGVAGWVLREQERTREIARTSGVWDQAERLARVAAVASLPGDLCAFGLNHGALAERLAAGMATNPLMSADPSLMSAFAGASALSRMLHETAGVTSDVLNAMQGLRGMELPYGTTVSGASALLDAAGLDLPLSRNPGLLEYAYLRFRPLPTKAERTARLKAMKQKAKPRPHHIRAFRNVNDTERLLRRFIDRAMTEVYGPEWTRERLPLCDCRDLLKRVEKRGGTVLENADWAHYERIMSDPRHFADVFSYGFEDVDVLREALSTAAPFRHAIMHFRDFTADNYRNLRAALAVLEEGLVDMIAFFPIEDNEEDDEWQVVE